MNQLIFKNGDRLDAIGLGTWKASPRSVERAVEFALKHGYRHIDCAKNYDNEAGVGRAFEKVFNSGILKREEVWVTSKLWNNAHRAEDVLPALKKSLHELRLDYLDLYLIHWPVAFKPEIENFPKQDSDYLSLEEVPLEETWNAMLEAKKQGLIRHAGVSNFSIKKLQHLAKKSPEMPEMLQVEMHPYLPQNELITFCKDHHIHLTGYSPLGSGDRKRIMKAPDEPVLLKDPVIAQIAQKHVCGPASVLIKWLEQRGVAVIPKAVKEPHIIANLHADRIQLDKEDLHAIDHIGTHYRFVDGEFFVTPGNPYDDIFDLR